MEHDERRGGSTPLDGEQLSTGGPPAGLGHGDQAHPDRGQQVPWYGVAFTFLLAVAAGGALWTGATGSGYAAADAAVLARWVQRRSEDTTLAAVTVTEIGNTAVMGALALGVAAWLLYRGRRADAVFAVLAWGGAVLLFSGLKLVFARPRPPEATRLVAVTNDSLPSGHATMSLVVLATIVVLAWAGRGVLARVTMVLVAAGWVAAVGFTRVYLGVHWMSDVVAGWLVGGAWVAACAATWLWWTRRREESLSPS